MEGTFVNKPNIQLMYDTLARILGEQHRSELKVTARKKDGGDKAAKAG